MHKIVFLLCSEVTRLPDELQKHYLSPVHAFEIQKTLIFSSSEFTKLCIHVCGCYSAAPLNSTEIMMKSNETFSWRSSEHMFINIHMM